MFVPPLISKSRVKVTPWVTWSWHGLRRAKASATIGTLLVSGLAGGLLGAGPPLPGATCSAGRARDAAGVATPASRLVISVRPRTRAVIIRLRLFLTCMAV